MLQKGGVTMLTGFRSGADIGKAALKLFYRDRKEFDHYNVDWWIKGETRINYRNHVPVSEICFFLADMLGRDDVEMICTSYHGSGEQNGSNYWVKSNKSTILF